ncbi:uncharacterized protein METZ01_LOCUS499913, partial [marine metagenome]
MTALLALFLSFGKNFFIYEIFYNYFPYFNKFRVPVMFLILTQFSVSILAGLGLDIISNLITRDKNDTLFKKVTGVFISIITLFFILKLFGVPKPGYFPKYPQSNLPSEVIINFDNLRLDMINSDMITAMLFLLFTGAVFYIARRGWVTVKGLAGIVITLTIADLALVDRKIIEPAKDSYRQSTMINKSLKSIYLSEDEVIRFFKKDT